MKKRLMPIMLSAVLSGSLFVGCANQAEATANTNEPKTSELSKVDIVRADEDMFTERDLQADYDASSAVEITLNGESASADDKTVNVSGSTITISGDKTYIISGTLNDGMIIVDGDDSIKPQIVLKDVSITNSASAAIYVKSANKVFITLEGENTLSTDEAFEAIDENNIDGTIFSKDDLTINGSGSLTVSASVGHGIVGKDDLAITGGKLNITSSNDGIQANDSIRIKDAEIEVNSGKDAMHAENEEVTNKGFFYMSSGTLNLKSAGDGISASSEVTIVDGNLSITAGEGHENGTKNHSDGFGMFGGGDMRNPGSMPNGQRGPADRMENETMNDRPAFEDSNAADAESTDQDGTSMKGIKAGTQMNLQGGEYKIDTADDAIHSNGSVTISSGEYSLATGDDGIHAEKTLKILDGTVHISQSYEGLEALDLEISGGKIDLVADDDGLNAAGGNDNSGMQGRDGMFNNNPMSSSSDGSITISGGTLYIQAGGDGIDANGSLDITGGDITVCGPSQGDTATLDYDVSATISGGTFIGTGAAGMAQSFSEASQGVIAMNVSNQQAGTEVVLKDQNGNVILSTTPELDYQIVILSSDKIESGKSYQLEIGNSTKTVTAK